MRTVLNWLLVVVVLFAQSAWAFEGHAGHFRADQDHRHASVPADEGSDKQAPTASTHCAHSPVHFVAVHRESVAVSVRTVQAEFPPYRAPVSSAHAEPPVQPPRG